MRILKNLQSVGLTEYEAKVYIALIKSQVNCATKLARMEVKIFQEKFKKMGNPYIVKGFGTIQIQNKIGKFK